MRQLHVPYTPSRFQEIFAVGAVFGTLHKDRPKEAADFSLPESWDINVSDEGFAEVDFRHIVAIRVAGKNRKIFVNGGGSTLQSSDHECSESSYLYARP